MYAVGEVVLMEWHGWLRAFRIVEVDEERNEYTMQMVELGGTPGWTRPGS
jgi:hypothetical protein